MLPTTIKKKKTMNMVYSSLVVRPITDSLVNNTHKTIYLQTKYMPSWHEWVVCAKVCTRKGGYKRDE